MARPIPAFSGLPASGMPSSISPWRGRQHTGSLTSRHNTLWVRDPAGLDRSVIAMRTDEAQGSASQDVVRMQLNGPGIISPGTVWTQVYEMFFPTSLPIVRDWFTLCSNYGRPFGGPGPMSISIRPTSTTADRLAFMADDGAGTIYTTPTPRGKWVVLARRFLFDYNGWMECYFAERGQPLRQVVARRPHRTRKAGVNDGANNEPRMTNYHEYGMPGWSGVNEWFCGRHETFSGAVSIADVDPYYIDGGSAPPPPPPPEVPATPTGFKLVRVGDGSASLDWNDSTDLRAGDQYEIEVI